MKGKRMAKKTWFTFDRDDGFMLHESEQHAKEYAQKLIDGWRDLAREDNEWPEDVDSVCYGQIVGKARPLRVEYEHDDRETFDYELKSVN
jgi:hypothetical protein